MAGLSNVSTGVLGTNVAPISFPGIASGIDYNSIIQKLTAMTLAPATRLENQIATLNAANAEIIKINGMLTSVQDALNGLSQPGIYNAVGVTSSNSTAATAQGIANGNAAPGTYTIQSTRLATATQIVSSTAAGHSERDALGTSTGDQVALANSYAAITPTNGSGSQGSVTINGVTVSYDVNTQSIQTIFANIQNAVRAATGDTSFTIGFSGTSDTVQITDANNPISLGASGDQGNLLQVLRLDQAQISNTATSGSVTGTAGVGGINRALMFNSTNGAGQATDANYVTPVTSGTFTINGVQITMNATTDNMASVLTRINQSAAGVLATYNSATGQVTLTNKNTGAQGIVLGSSGDTSNFLTATGLTAGSGAATTIGTQAAVTFQDASGSTHTVYSNSNTVTTAIPGVQLNLLSNTTTPFQVTVSQDTTQLAGALNTFISAYNNVVNEINVATAAPVVAQSTAGSSIGVGASSAVGGGVLFGNADVNTIKDRLVTMITSLVPGSTTYSSLSQIGVNLTDSFTQLVANSSSSSGGSSGSTSTGSAASPISTQTFAGTDGQIQPLDVSKLNAALAANPSAVGNLLNGAQGLVATMGAYLTGVTGLPTQSANGLLGTIPNVSLMQNYQNSNSSEVTSIQQQITMIRDNANQQADALRAEFVSSETQLAGFQSLQQQLSSFFKSGG